MVLPVVPVVDLDGERAGRSAQAVGVPPQVVGHQRHPPPSASLQPPPGGPSPPSSPLAARRPAAPRAASGEGDGAAHGGKVAIRDRIRFPSGATVPVGDVATAFVVVFLAELGDKTQLVALTLAGRYPARQVLLALGAAIARAPDHLGHRSARC